MLQRVRPVGDKGEKVCAVLPNALRCGSVS